MRNSLEPGEPTLACPGCTGQPRDVTVIRLEVAAGIVVDERNGIGRIELNRDSSTDPFDCSMVRTISEALNGWADDDDIHAVLLSGAGQGWRAGCPTVLKPDVVKSAALHGRDFWLEVYRLNAAMARFDKPCIAIMDGLMMGAAFSIGAHAHVRVITERTTLRPTDSSVMFMPDLGGIQLLARSPGELGTHIALTNSRLRPGDAITCGLADYYVPSRRLDAFLDMLSCRTIDKAVRDHAEPLPRSTLIGRRGWIDSAYGADSVAEIIGRLSVIGDPVATRSAARLRANSSVSARVLEYIRKAATFVTLDEAFQALIGSPGYRAGQLCYA